MSAGIQAGDIVISIDNQPLDAYPEATSLFIDKIQNSPNIPLPLVLKRGEKTLDVTITAIANEEGKGKIGVALSPNVSVKHAQSIGEALSYSANAYERIIVLTVQGFWQLISHFSENAQQVAGPIKIVEYGANIARNDISNLFQFGALISINLAVINILPLPALDGGQLVFLLIEGILGKPLPNKIQENFMQTGLVLLLGLGIFLIVRDTVNLTFFQELLHQELR